MAIISYFSRARIRKKSSKYEEGQNKKEESEQPVRHFLTTMIIQQSAGNEHVLKRPKNFASLDW